MLTNVKNVHVVHPEFCGKRSVILHPHVLQKPLEEGTDRVLERDAPMLVMKLCMADITSVHTGYLQRLNPVSFRPLVQNRVS